MHSIVLTVHNKDWLLSDVLDGIKKNTTGDYEIVIVLDGCGDKSEEIWKNFSQRNLHIKTKTVHTPDVFETKANNAGLKVCEGDKVIIVQDDMVIKEVGWNKRLEMPFKYFNDVGIL